MPSWQARSISLATSLILRRRSWGDVRVLAARARLLFGAPSPYALLATRGLDVRRISEGAVRGEWLTPRHPLPGTILYIHGGGFVACSPASHRPITSALARYTNRPVMSLDYRLSPEHPFPAASDDVFAAYRWLLSTGVSPSTIAVAGDSAGGNLTLGLLVRARDAGLPLPACAACFSPWTDLAATSPSITANDGRCAMFHPENMAQFSAPYLDGVSPDDPRASPFYADMSGLPPILFQVGSTELLLDDSRRMHDRIRTAGGESRLEIFDDVIHCWQMLDGIIPEARVALKQSAAFITSHITGS